jgi:hypothetical protein
MPHSCALIQPASSDGSWAFSQSFMPPQRCSRSPGLHRPGLHLDPPPPDQGNQSGFAHCSAGGYGAGCLELAALSWRH